MYHGIRSRGRWGVCLITVEKCDVLSRMFDKMSRKCDAMSRKCDKISENVTKMSRKCLNNIE